jgi:hypothetical protein
MSKNTVKPALTRKRPKRAVENTEFDAFVRRILAAYGRRVANGDVEALRLLALLSSEVDAVTRLAILGLRKEPFRYSWAEIADRLGTTKQAAQMRYGDRTDRGSLDRRLVEAGLSVTVATLAAVFADHHPGSPAASVCPGCGYRYPENVFDCPTLATVRPVLYRRRSEDRKALEHLTPDQYADLHNLTTARGMRAAARRLAQSGRTPYGDSTPALFDVHARGGV